MNMFGIKTTRGAVSVLATAFLVLATSLSGSAQEATDDFTITVLQADDPCLMYTDSDATWSVDPWVQLNSLYGSSSDVMEVYPGTNVDISLSYSFMEGQTCGELTPATGTVTATWELTGLNLSNETCVEGCDVTSVFSVSATAVVPEDATADNYVGSITLNWVP